MGINYTKWGFVLGTGIAALTLVSSITVPEFRCFIGLKSESCPVKNEFVDIKLIIETEDSQSLEGVEVQFINKNGAPEVKMTNSDGFVQIKIPITGDIDIKLSKAGFQTLTRTVNLGVDPDRTKKYQLKKLTATIPNPINTTSPPQIPSPTPTPPQDSSVEPSVITCVQVKGNRETAYSEDISVGRKPLKPEGRMYLNPSRSLTCRITKNTGSETFIYALPDNSRLQKVSISLYLEGKLTKTLDINRGSSAPLSFNTANINSFAIEYTGYGNYDNLYRIPLSGN